MSKRIIFGSGSLFGIADLNGIPTPVRFGEVQEISVEMSGSMKEFHGDSQFPVDTARGKSKITCKAKFGRIRGALQAALFFNEPLAAGHYKAALDEAGTIPANPGPYTLTVANGATFSRNLGVRFASDGAYLSPVASNPAAGQYAVSAVGVYTFAAADQGKAVLIDYLYEVEDTGQTIAITNQAMGDVPSFMAIHTRTYKGFTMTMILNSCNSTKLAMPFKQEDYMVQELDYEASADENDKIGLISFSEA